MRGKGRVRHAVHRFVGITPACAGKSLSASDQTVCPKDHPRVCGEKCSTTCRTCAPSGSPPRMRGKGGVFPGAVRADGITPAYAGKRPGNVSGAHNVWDHPRVCGEKRRSSWCRPCSGGSPPRMRGKVRHADSWCLTFGITPAYAGKRSTSCP